MPTQSFKAGDSVLYNKRYVLRMCGEGKYDHFIEMREDNHMSYSKYGGDGSWYVDENDISLATPEQRMYMEACMAAGKSLTKEECTPHVNNHYSIF